MKRHFLLFTVLIFFSTFFNSCDNSDETLDPNLFVSYINSYTTGTISRYSSIIVVLNNPVELAVKNANANDLISLSPDVDGEARWIGDRILEFRPNGPLEGGEKYKVKFELGKILEVEEKLQTFVFEVAVREQLLNVELEFPQFSEEGELFIPGRLILSDRDELGKMQKCVEAKLLNDESAKLTIEWESFMEYPLKCEYKFKVKGVRPKQYEEQTVRVSWNGSAVDSKSEGFKDVNISATNDFHLVASKIINNSDACIELYFSQILSPNQDWNSLCYFKESMPLTFIRSGNVLKVFPEKTFYKPRKLVLNAKLKGVSQSELGKDTILQVQFESIKPAVKLINDGVILPMSSTMGLPFRAVNLKAVDVRVIKLFENNILQFMQENSLDCKNAYQLNKVAQLVLQKKVDLDDGKMRDLTQWQTFSLDLSELAKKEPGAIYHVILSFKREYSLYPCAITDTLDSSIDYYQEAALTEDLAFYDYSGIYQNNCNYVYDYDYDYDYEKNKKDPSKIDYYTDPQKKVKVNLLLSDLGIIVKAGKNKSYTAVVTNLMTAQPEEDATVYFYDYQQQLIAEAQTDQDGFVNIKLKKTPVFAVVKKNQQVGYLRLMDEKALSLSSFDVSGAKYVKGVKGYVYGERGVWRPGDTLHVSLMIQDQDKSLPSGHPIVMKLKNPQGQNYAQMMQKYDSTSCIYSFAIPTQSDAPTGNWSVSFTLGGSVFQKNLMIETIKPNRLKIDFQAENKVLVPDNDEHFTLHSEWLHGAKAGNKDAVVLLKYKPVKTTFPKYKDYIFDAPSASYSTEEQELYSGITDANGDLSFDVHMPKYENPRGMLQAFFTTRVFEGEGDYSFNYSTKIVSPYSAYVGLKMPENDEYYYLSTNKDHVLQLVTVDRDGNPVDLENLTLKMYRLEWHWWWDSDDDDYVAYYTENNYYTPFFQKSNITTKNGKATVTVKVPNDDWGKYLICIEDEEGGHVTGETAYFDYGYNTSRNKGNSKGATMLTFSLDKEKYNVGDKMHVNIPSSENGRALITIESRSKVLYSQWIDTKKGNTTFDLEVTKEMCPNAYLYVMLLQPYAQTVNDLPIRMYGVRNVNVEDKETILHPEFKMKDVIESEKEFSVTVSERDKKEMCYTLAIVDDGILDLTNFITPNAYSEFYKKEALGVNTWDMFDLVIGAYGGKIEQLFSIGGDQVASSNEDASKSRFKPVVKFIGPLKLGAGETRTHKITLPAYFGSVRVMLVAGNETAYGCSEKSVKVQKPLMIFPTLPRVVGLNEEITLPVTVFSMDGKKKDVKVSVKSSKFISVVDTKSKDIHYSGSDEKVVYFKLKSGELTGYETIQIIASDGTNEVKSSITLQVRNPSAKYTESQFYTIPAGTSIDCHYDLFGMKGTNTNTLEVARIAPVNLNEKLNYLIGYPHGCAEQTVSKAFPQLLMKDLTKLSAEDAMSCEENVKEAILKLNKMQLSNGSVSYWMNGDYSYDWVTNYVGHFFLEAKSKGYDIPSAFLPLWYDYQKNEANSWSNSTDHVYSSDIQAYRLYTLALYGKPEVSAMNRLKEKKLSTVAKWRLAAAYALIGQKEVAINLTKNLSLEVESYSRFNLSFGSSLRDKAMILDVIFLINGVTPQTLRYAKQISDEIAESKYLNTQELSYYLVSMSHIAAAVKSSDVNISYTCEGKSYKLTDNSFVSQQKLPVTKLGKNVMTVKNGGTEPVFITLTQSGFPLNTTVSKSSNGLNMKVKYLTLDGDPVNVEQMNQGTDFIMVVKLENTSAVEGYTEVALTQVIPSGWEIINQRMSSGEENKDSYSYQDIRDDRVMTYFSLDSSQEKTFKLHLHAAYKGKFFAPAILCESMYDPSIYARDKGFWTVIGD